MSVPLAGNGPLQQDIFGSLKELGSYAATLSVFDCLVRLRGHTMRAVLSNLEPCVIQLALSRCSGVEYRIRHESPVSGWCWNGPKRCGFEKTRLSGETGSAPTPHDSWRSWGTAKGGKSMNGGNKFRLRCRGKSRTQNTQKILARSCHLSLRSYGDLVHNLHAPTFAPWASWRRQTSANGY